MSNPPFGFDRPKDSPGFLLWQTTMSWQRLIKKALEPYTVSHAQFVLMAILLWYKGKKTDLTQMDLIRLSNLDKMTVSKSLKKLVIMELVVRYENAEDSRAKTVCLTKSGEILAKKLIPLVESIDGDFFSQLTQQEQAGLIYAFQKLSVDKIGEL